MASEESQFSLEYFKDTRASAGVRQIQGPYEELLDAAKASGKTVEEEMKSHGYINYQAFSKTCPRFSLFCWPIDLAELGSGAVLYFHFLTLMGLILLLCFLLQIPMLMSYNDQDSIGLWRYYGSWIDFYQQSGPCICPASGGSWTPALLGKCRSYEKDACSWDGSSEGFISSSWLTPGNFAPNSATESLPLLLFVAMVALIASMCYIGYQLQTITDRKVDGQTTQPNDFAVLVRGMPITATDESSIKQWFQENAVAGSDSTEVVKVVIGWDAGEFREKRRQMLELKKELDELETDDPRTAEVKKEMMRIQTHLASAANEGAARLRSSGLVVVIFRKQCDHRACLDRWGSFWARRFYREPQDLFCFPAGNHLLPGAPLPRYPIGDTPAAVISIERAANPGDINWEDMGVDTWTRRRMLLRTNGAMFLLICASFGITWGLNKLQLVLAGTTSNSSGGSKFGYQLLSLLPTLGVGILNAALSISATYLGKKEYHDTVTEQEFSQALKMSIGMIINTGLVMYFVNAQPSQWYVAAGLCQDIFWMLLFNTILPGIFTYFDIGYAIKCRKRRKLTQAKLADMNEQHRLGKLPSATPAQREALRQDVTFFTKAFQPSAIRTTRRYAGALKTFVCCLYFSPVMPVVSLVGFVGLFLQYWVDKWVLLKWALRPARPQNAAMCQAATRFVMLVGPLGLSVSFYVFVSPSWQDKQMVLNRFILMIIISVVGIFLPMSLTRGLLETCFGTGTGETDADSSDYYTAQYMWVKEMKYHKDHFLYKRLPEAKNPEHLTPKADGAVKLDDVKASYKIGTTTDAAHSSSDVLRLRGGKAVATIRRYSESPVEADGLDADSKDDGPAAATYGAASPEAIKVSPRDDAPAADVTDVHVPVAAPAMSTSGTDDIPTVPLVGVVATPRWEFEVGHGHYKPFGDDCQEFLEKKWQGFKSGQRSRINVNTSGKQVSVDFERMTSKVNDSHKIRTIRRIEPP